MGAPGCAAEEADEAQSESDGALQWTRFSAKLGTTAPELVASPPPFLADPAALAKLAAQYADR